MKKKANTLTQEELQLFRDSMRDVRPMQYDGIEPHKEKKAPARQPFIQSEEQSPNRLIVDPDHIPLLCGTEVLFFHRGGLQQRFLKKVKTGQIQVEAIMDLHGLTRTQAADRLVNFLETCRQQGLLCVRVIHGKGVNTNEQKSVLKSLVNQWLQQLDYVLAFTSSPPKDGGTGAVNIILKKSRS